MEDWYGWNMGYVVFYDGTVHLIINICFEWNLAVIKIKLCALCLPVTMMLMYGTVRAS